jgi:hypothetical protein
MATFQLSPGVNWSEYDLTDIIPAVATSPGAIAGVFSWGPIGELTLITSEANLVAQFGTPTNFNYETWFVAKSFLDYTNTLWVVRGANTTAPNSQISAVTAIGNVGSVANIYAQTTKSDNSYLNHLGTYDENLLYIAKYPGIAGNSLRISIVDNANAFNSTINAVSSVANGVFQVNAGSNVATFIVEPAGVGTLTSATAMATTVQAEIVLGDLILVGNSTIGQQYIQVDSVSTITTNAIASFFTVNLTDPYRLSVNWTSNTVVRFWEFFSVISDPIAQSWYMTNYGNGNPSFDEMNIVVVDDGGYFSGVPGTVLEKYAGLSRATDATNIDGTDNYYVSVLNNSRYIRWTNDNANCVSNVSYSVTNSLSSGVLDIVFNGGSDGASESNVAPNMVTNAYQLFVNPENVDIGLVMTGKSIGGIEGELMGNWILQNITMQRRDCVGFVSPPLNTVVHNYGNEVTSLVAFRDLMTSTSYGFLDSGYKQMYDTYNNFYRWVPLNGDMAGLCARTDFTNNPWWAPAGFNRGQLVNLTQLAFNPGLADRNILFPVNINPVVTFNTQGTVLYGDKTLQAESSAFDAINVRRLFIVLEKAISKAAAYFLWEFNDSYTQAQVRNMINPYLRTIEGLRGIYDFLVVCDSTNNTGEIIDMDMLVCDIYVQPARAIRNIQLNFIATPTGVQFSEVEGQFSSGNAVH